MPDWQRVADAVRSARLTRGLTQDQLGTSKQTVITLEAAAQDDYRDVTLAKIERALGWPTGTIRDIADGGPIPDTEHTPSEMAQVRAELAAIRRLLEQIGRVLLDDQRWPPT